MPSAFGNLCKLGALISKNIDGLVQQTEAQTQIMTLIHWRNWQQSHQLGPESSTALESAVRRYACKRAMTGVTARRWP
jgi:hypothetical protein